MNKGDIVLIPFPFTDLSGDKNRPALILFDSEDDVTVCFITTQLKWKSAFDIPVQPSPVNGIKNAIQSFRHRLSHLFLRRSGQELL